jgi:hypothetical protein
MFAYISMGACEFDEVALGSSSGSLENALGALNAARVKSRAELVNKLIFFIINLLIT